MYEKAFANGESQTALSLNRLGFSYLSLHDYNAAIKNLEGALEKKPMPAGELIIRSRLARAYAAKNKNGKALEQLDSIISHGYTNMPELDTAKEYDNMRNEAAFKNLLSRATDNLYPCLKNAHAREFDFWVGEWNVYPTGSDKLVGNSSIQ
ncbi:MAG: hypothetical protein ABI091_09650, partial [Ferruginibacter sp.]